MKKSKAEKRRQTIISKLGLSELRQKEAKETKDQSSEDEYDSELDEFDDEPGIGNWQLDHKIWKILSFAKNNISVNYLQNRKK